MDASSIRTDSLRLIAVAPFHVEAPLRDKREPRAIARVASGGRRGVRAAPDATGSRPAGHSGEDLTPR
jgi:hypothetical protein